jgi:hypothetical protein
VSAPTVPVAVRVMSRKLFLPGQRIDTAEQFATAVKLLTKRHGALRGYLRMKSEGVLVNLDTDTTSLIYRFPFDSNQFEMMLSELSRKLRKDLDLYTYWLEATGGEGGDL